MSEAALCRELKKVCALTVVCPAAALDRKFAASYGLEDVRAYTPGQAAAAFFSARHWLARLVSGAELAHFCGHWRWDAALLARVAEARGIPYLAHPRGMFLVGHKNVFLKKIFNAFFGRRFARKAARVIALSRYEIQQFAPYGLPRERIEVVPNGIVVDGEVPLTARDGPWGAEKKFLYLGRIERRKRVLFLLESFARYRAEGGRTALALVGPAQGADGRDVRRRIARADLAGAVTLYPPQYEGEKWAYLTSARALIYPAEHEAFGRVPFEAVAVGTLPIVPRESGAAEYLAQFFPELTYDDDSAESLVAALNRVDTWAGRGETPGLEAAQTWLRSELDWRAVGRRVMGIYESVLKK